MKRKHIILATASFLFLAAIIIKYWNIFPANILPRCFDVVSTITVNEITSTYTYESPGGQGRLISKVSSNSTSVTYDYTMPGMIKEKTTNPPSSPTTRMYVVNGLGYPISDDRGTGIAGSPYTYEYDNSGHLIKAIYPNFTDNRKYTGGNLTKEWQTGNSDPGIFIIKYTNYCNSINQQGIFGIDSKEWPLQISGTYLSGSGNFITDFTYELDSSGRVIKQTKNTNRVITVLTFTYY